MNIRIMLAVFFVLSCAHAFAATNGKITISSPANGTTVSSHNQVPLTYDAILGPNGDHLHLYVDGNRVDILRQAKATTELAAMAPGKHHICLEVNTKAHVSTGVESCVDVMAK